MATSVDYITFVCEKINKTGNVRYKKMFGEYIVYIDDKPILLVCDNTVFVKTLPQLKHLMNGAKKSYPYPGAKEHYILNIEDVSLTKQVVCLLKTIIPTPIPKKNKR